MFRAKWRNVLVRRSNYGGSERCLQGSGSQGCWYGDDVSWKLHNFKKSLSPVLHVTPASKSGPLSLANHNSTTSTIDLIRLKECHFAKLQVETQYNSVTSLWSSREEEEKEISKLIQIAGMLRGNKTKRPSLVSSK